MSDSQSDGTLSSQNQLPSTTHHRTPGHYVTNHQPGSFVNPKLSSSNFLPPKKRPAPLPKPQQLPCAQRQVPKPAHKQTESTQNVKQIPNATIRSPATLPKPQRFTDELNKSLTAGPKLSGSSDVTSTSTAATQRNPLALPRTLRPTDELSKALTSGPKLSGSSDVTASTSTAATQRNPVALPKTQWFTDELRKSLISEPKHSGSSDVTSTSTAATQRNPVALPKTLRPTDELSKSLTSGPKHSESSDVTPPSTAATQRNPVALPKTQWFIDELSTTLTSGPKHSRSSDVTSTSTAATQRNPVALPKTQRPTDKTSQEHHVDSRSSVVREDEYILENDIVTMTSNMRPLWAQNSRVIGSSRAGTLSKAAIEFQEVKFEIFTSEASYYKSLTVFESHFMENALLNNESVLSKTDHELLFSPMTPIKRCSRAFLHDLNNCWQSSIFLPDLFDIIDRHSHQNFSVYITFCTRLNEILKKLMSLSENKKFSEIMTALEKSEISSCLPCSSFLTLPMTRITRLPLLLETASKSLRKYLETIDTDEYEYEQNSCNQALDSVRKCAQDCNMAVKRNDRMQKMFQLQAKLTFPIDVNQIALISPHRWLILRGEVRSLSWCEYKNVNSRKGKSSSKNTNVLLRLYLLNDMLIFTKPILSRDDSFTVVDYSLREHITLSFPNPFESLNSDLVKDSAEQYKILMGIRENHDKKRIEIILSCILEKERDMWVKILSSSHS